jgi:hypothetical protein
MKRGIVLAIVIGLGNLGGCVFHLRSKSWEGGGAHTNVKPQDLFFIHLLSTATFSHRTRYSTRLPWYEVCTATSSQWRNKSFIRLTGSMICSCTMMWTYRNINKEKEEQCAREGIDESMKDMYRDLADKSPLFR